MDRKTLAIVVLTVTATLLAGVVAQGLRDTPAYGQTGRGGPGISYRYSDYVMAPMTVSQNADVLCLTDTVTLRMLFFKYNISTKALEVYGKGVELTKDFGR
jgi:hypothetical protein